MRFMSGLDYYKNLREDATNEKFCDLNIRREYENPEKPVVMVWRGKQSKPFYRYRQHSIEFGEKKILELKAKAKSYQDEDEAKKIGKAEALANYQVQMKVGDILSDSWGYDQTNVEFYKVLEVKGRTAIIQELCHCSEHEGYDHGKCTPSEKTYGESIKKRIMIRYYHSRNGEKSSIDEYIKINECVTLSPWDGRPMYFSSGH